MKKSIIIIALAVLGAGVTFVMTLDFLVTKKLSGISFTRDQGPQKEEGDPLNESEILDRQHPEDERVTSPVKHEVKRNFSPPLKVVKKFLLEAGNVYKWIAREQYIYIQDPYTQQILKLDSSGNLIDVYGSKGGAPWEHEGIMSFEILNDDLYTADNSKMTIKRGALGDKNLQYHHKIRETFWDAALLRDDRFVVFLEEQNDQVGDFSFRVYDAVNNQFGNSTSFRELLKLDKAIQYLNIAYGGHFIRSETGHLLYVCSRTGLFLSFDETGNVTYVKETIDRSPPPKVSVKKSGKFTMFIREPDLNINYSATAGPETLYILSLVRFQKAKNLVVDQYKIENGEYSGSIEIPNDDDSLPGEILITSEGKLWVLYENMNIIIYKLAQ